MLARVQSYLLQGIDALPCEVEVDHDESAESDKGFKPTIVGLPDAGVKESHERVRSAITNSGYFWPRGRILINLAPAESRKEGPAYDLPIAIGLLMVQGVIADHPTTWNASQRNRSRSPSLTPQPSPLTSSSSQPSPLTSSSSSSVPCSLSPVTSPLDYRRFLFAGELALDGRLRPIKGAIALAALARDRGYVGVILPADNAAEASLVSGIDVLGVRTLTEVVGLLNGLIEPQPHPPTDVASLLRSAAAPIDFSEVRGQESVKRAIVIAAGGDHNLIMVGPAGTGKSMMAKALPGVLPPLTPDEAIEITRIYSAAGALPPGASLITSRPVRSPHHTASSPAIVGGGMIPRPGEISLAHKGVLFLDELPEFPRFVLETLRQPMEDHVVTIARAHGSLRFPASFMLVAAMNPTARGHVAPGESGKWEMERYVSRLSGPLLDRIDIHIEAPAVPFKELSSAPRGTSTAQMRDQVAQARARQSARQGPSRANGRLSGKELDQHAPLDDAARNMLGQSITEMGLSARAYDKIRRVARTIADIEGSDHINARHVAEAVQYRLLDRKT